MNRSEDEEKSLLQNGDGHGHFELQPIKSEDVDNSLESGKEDSVDYGNLRAYIQCRDFLTFCCSNSHYQAISGTNWYPL